MTKQLSVFASDLKDVLLSPSQGVLWGICLALLVGIATPPDWVLAILPEQSMSLLNTKKSTIGSSVLILGFLLSYTLILHDRGRGYYACSNLEKSNKLIEAAFAALRNRPNLDRNSVDVFSEMLKSNGMYLSKYAASLLRSVLDSLFAILTANAELEDINLSNESRRSFLAKITEAQKNLDCLEDKLSDLKGNLHDPKA